MKSIGSLWFDKDLKIVLPAGPNRLFFSFSHDRKPFNYEFQSELETVVITLKWSIDCSRTLP